MIINTPLNIEQSSQLKAGQKVYISGVIYTSRDQAHKRIIEAIKSGGESPFPLKNSILFYVGPSPAKPGEVIGSAGPTTSYRMDDYTPFLLDRGLKGMIGKGKRSPEVIESMIQNGAVYFVAIGGAGALLSSCIKKAEVIAYPDLGPEAVFRLEVENFPCFVGVDSLGNSIIQ